MSRYITIKENRDFLRIYKRGKSFVSPVLVTYILKNRSHNLRYGITTGKKTGNAVKRSRARRVIRAAYFELFPQIKPGYDIVFVARTKTAAVKSNAVYEAMKKQLKTADLLIKRDDGNEKNSVGND